jgi:hypothetical protein
VNRFQGFAEYAAVLLSLFNKKMSIGVLAASVTVDF